MIRPGYLSIKLLLILSLLLAATIAHAQNRILIDTKKANLSVLNDSKVLFSVDDIAIGRFGAKRGIILGDGKTPLGSYRVTEIRQSEHFHFFIGLDYPSVTDATLGLEKGIITREQAQQIRSAHAKGATPPQNTALGGFIGVHGIGKGDPAVHAVYNWTRGCVAVTDAQLEELLPLIKVGTQVDIK